ncbi:type II secretion system F family protein [Malaciobacter mytili]|uniref:Transformation system protein n=1 Tax=Malaciobacter mytili LMG 24559 TaxID=1032238 RepID=A0AAX2AJ03_9BACT|nr:type II secretion system F family protein [Malaciobacter mytili]AXH15653.1 type II secretion/transformation system, F protein [Malaciobacter mytili LMG 24559]RXK16161.1 transformation system protein [Malaciobacter mytili LMG 24559]
MKYEITYQKNSKLYKEIIEKKELRKINKNIIEIKKLESKTFNLFKKKITLQTAYYFFLELNLMLKAKIHIKEALELLLKNKKDKNIKEFISVLLENINCGKGIDFNSLSFSLDSSVKNFFKIANSKGNIYLTVNALTNFLKFNLKIKKELIKAFSYPFILLITLFFCIFSIFYIVLPSFELFLFQEGVNKNLATLLLFKLKDFLKNYFMHLNIIFSLSFIVVYIFYKLNKRCAYLFDKIILQNIPIFSSLVLNLQMYRLFIILNILQKENYEFHSCLNSLSSLIKNKYLLDKITQIENLLKSGKSISYSFSSTKIFDDVVLNLIQTGENSNCLKKATLEIEKIYKNSYKRKIKSLCFWIQPFVFIIILGLILWIIFAIFVPIWSISEIIKY